MQKFNGWIVRIERIVSSILIAGVVLFVFFAAVMRWVGYPIAWSVEFAQLLFVWSIFLGADLALREGRHIGVDFITKRLPRKVALALEVLMLTLMLLFLILVGSFGIKLSIENFSRIIGNLPISYSFVTIAVPFGCLLMIITLVTKLCNFIFSRKENPTIKGQVKIFGIYHETKEE